MTTTEQPLRDLFRRNGFFIQNDVISASDVQSLRRAVAALPECDEVRRKRRVYGVRNLLEVCGEARELAADRRIQTIASHALGKDAFAVRAVFFDKVPDANWSLFWHQDNVIAVKQPINVDGFTAWSQKAGVWQVQPPPEILAKMIAIRVHLDDCHRDNGPLRVLPGSHRHGWLDEQLDAWKSRVTEVVCEVDAGGIVAMCPLTLHASAEATTASHRRVIHIEYATSDLPAGLQWRWQIHAN